LADRRIDLKGHKRLEAEIDGKRNRAVRKKYRGKILKQNSLAVLKIMSVEKHKQLSFNKNILHGFFKEFFVELKNSCAGGIKLLPRRIV